MNMEPPEGLHEHNDMVWCLTMAVNGLRDASRLFRDTSLTCSHHVGFRRSEAQPTLFMDLARSVFMAVPVEDLIMVGMKLLVRCNNISP